MRNFSGPSETAPGEAASGLTALAICRSDLVKSTWATDTVGFLAKRDPMTGCWGRALRFPETAGRGKSKHQGGDIFLRGRGCQINGFNKRRIVILAPVETDHRQKREPIARLLRPTRLHPIGEIAKAVKPG
jgi:hypothetical protein